MKLNKKALGPVIAASLLIVVVTVSLVSFQNWFGTYQDNLFVKSETKSNNGVSLVIDSLIKTNSNEATIYAKSGIGTFQVINEIKVNGEVCTLSSSDVIDDSISTIELECDFNAGDKNIIILTDSGIYEKKFYVK